MSNSSDTPEERLIRIDERTKYIRDWIDKHERSHQRWLMWVLGATLALVILAIETFGT